MTTNDDNVGFFSYVFSFIWLLVPSVTFIFFNDLIKTYGGNTIQLFQMLCVLVTLSISYYFVDKNAYESKFNAIMSASNNALITFFGLMITLYIFELTNLYSEYQNIAFLAIIAITFISLTVISNKNSESNYSIFSMIILLVLNLLIMQTKIIT